MGKRKSSKPPPKKKQLKVDKVFDCPFCNNAQSVECKLDRINDVGTVSCRICGASYSTSINNLTEAIDIFSEWIDESVAVNKGDGGGGEGGAAEAVKAGRAGADSE